MRGATGYWREALEFSRGCGWDIAFSDEHLAVLNRSCFALERRSRCRYKNLEAAEKTIR